jgi:hypothetical protein
MEFQKEFHAINEKANLILEQIEDSEISQSRIDRITITLKETNTDIQDITIQLEKEKRDVENLKNMSFTKLYYTIIGERETQLNKEEMEVFQVKANLNKFLAEKANYEKKLDDLKLKLKNSESLQIQYENLMDKKSQLVKVHNPELWDKIEKNQNKINHAKYRMKGIDEAIVEGNVAKSYMPAVIKMLTSAKNWGIADMMGGSFLATWVKHDYLDSAQYLIQQFQIHLASFNQELKDIGGSIDFDMQIGKYLEFADFMYSDIYANWIVQEKIGEFRKKINKLHNKLIGFLCNLQIEIVKNKNEIMELEEENEKILQEYNSL